MNIAQVSSSMAWAKTRTGLILGIETSCDETSASVVADGRRILSNIISSQVPLHKKYGGVVPEIASRKHLETVLPVVHEALTSAGVGLKDIEAVAVTYGPGLVGTLLVGLSAAKAIAWARDIPLVGVNHLVGHIYANFLTDDPPEFPVICLVVSGGHTDLLYLRDHGSFEIMGRTRDDAAGEAFDKVARSLGLGYPGGPLVERLAREGDPAAVPFPRVYLEEGTYDFSFSGLKTAVLQHMKKAGEKVSLPDVAAGFQQAVVDVLADKACRAARERGVRRIILAGGVASNGALRKALEDRALPLDLKVSYPPPILCTDNAAMIASAGYYSWRAGQVSGLDLNALPTLGFGDNENVPVGQPADACT